MREALRYLNGLFVGQLTPDELLLFEEGCKLDLCYRSYEGGAGFMRLARVRLR